MVPSTTVHVPGDHRLDNENDHTQNRRNGIQWTLWSQLDDLDFADDLTLLSHTHEQMQEKTDLLNLVAAQTGLNIMNKTQIMRANTKNKNVVTVEGKPLEETDCFTYLGCKTNKTGGTEEATKARFPKTRNACLILSKSGNQNRSSLRPR